MKNTKKKTLKENNWINFKTFNDECFLIACDLDGTLLNSNGELSTNTIRGIKEVSKKGHIVCLITGRPYDGAIKIYNQLGLKTIMANQNGSFISIPHDKNYIPIAMGFSKMILKQILENRILKNVMHNTLIEGMGVAWLWNKASDEILHGMKDMFHLDGRIVENANEDFSKITTDIASLLFEIKSIDNLNSIIYEIKNIAPTLIVRNWSLPNKDSFIIEVNTQFATKQTAIRYISSYYGIPKERWIAFGDGDNDVEMLQNTT